MHESPHALETDQRSCIIGAGASGLCAAKALSDRGLPYDHFEMGSDIGGVWRYDDRTGRTPAYRNLHLITSKTHTAFADFPMPEDIPVYAPHDEVLRYLKEYARTFGLREQIRLNTQVVEVVPRDDGRWNVRVAGGEMRTYGAVLVCTGHLWKRRWPEVPGHFSGKSMHAREYRRPEEFSNKRVLVVGIGNSACDIAVDVSHTAEAVYLSTRSSAWILPKYLFGIPTDQWTGYYMEYLPLWIRRQMLRLLRWCAVGRQEAYGVPAPEHKLFEEHPTLNQELLSHVHHGRIRIKPDIERLEGQFAVFQDGSREEVDRIIYATGYHISFPFLPDDLFSVVDNHVFLYRSVVAPDLPHLYFIGLLQPLGALFPLAERQSKWIAAVLDGTVHLPDRKAMVQEIKQQQTYRARRYHDSPRHTLEVDFWTYVHEMEREMKRGRRRAEEA